jgi:hypothetical protein
MTVYLREEETISGRHATLHQSVSLNGELRRYAATIMAY